MDKIINLNELHKPGWETYLVTFKDQDMHPFKGINMKGRAVRIIAPNDEAAKIVVKHKFGTSFYQLHYEKKISEKMYPNGIYETLIFRKV